MVLVALPLGSPPGHASSLRHGKLTVAFLPLATKPRIATGGASFPSHTIPFEPVTIHLLKPVVPK
jgi:hypothetical protein